MMPGRYAQARAISVIARGKASVEYESATSIFNDPIEMLPSPEPARNLIAAVNHESNASGDFVHRVTS